MFTPPPSPLPPLQISPVTGSSSEDEEDMLDSPSSLSPVLPKPRRSSPLRQSFTLPKVDDLARKRTSKRRILIPLIAALLVVIAVSSKLSSTSTYPSSLLTLTRSTASSSLSSQDHQVLRIRAKRKRSAHLAHFRNGSLALNKRQEIDPDAKMTFSSPTATDIPTTTSSASPVNNGHVVNPAIDAAKEPPAIPDPPFPVPTPFPQPFDASFSYNFTTASCASFVDGFLSNITFRACRPFSLLLPSSSEFFEAQDDLTKITSIIGGTCNTRLAVDDCLRTMDWLSQEIQKDTTCGKDLKDQVLLPVTALDGFRNYKMMREAGCLVNQRTNTYCFADAVAATSPSDFYYYALPLGTPIPGKNTPSCSTCIQSLLSIYATQANNKTMLISSTYPAAAEKAQSVCGAKYAVSVSKDSAAKWEREVKGMWVWSASMVMGGLVMGLGSLSSLLIGGI